MTGNPYSPPESRAAPKLVTQRGHSVTGAVVRFTILAASTGVIAGTWMAASLINSLTVDCCVLAVAYGGTILFGLDRYIRSVPVEKMLLAGLLCLLGFFVFSQLHQGARFGSIRTPGIVSTIVVPVAAGMLIVTFGLSRAARLTRPGIAGIWLLTTIFGSALVCLSMQYPMWFVAPQSLVSFTCTFLFQVLTIPVMGGLLAAGAISSDRSNNQNARRTERRRQRTTQS